MSESIKHMELIKIIKKYVEENLKIEKAFLKYDLIGEYKTEGLINGYRPDVSYNYNKQVIIGEAKTQNDIDRIHSIEQYKSYLEYCNLNGKNSIFILAVPWTETIYAKKILRKVKKQYKIKSRIFILNDVEKVCEI